MGAQQIIPVKPNPIKEHVIKNYFIASENRKRICHLKIAMGLRFFPYVGFFPPVYIKGIFRVPN